MSNEEKAKQLFEAIIGNIPNKAELVPVRYMDSRDHMDHSWRRWESLPQWYAEAFRQAVLEI